MSNKLPPIYFYLPDWNSLPKEMLDHTDTYHWSSSQLPDGERVASDGKYAWLLQTYLHLKADGFPCQLTDTIPTEGIVLAHRKSLPDDLQPGPRLLLVCLRADKTRHPHAQLHIVVNPQQENLDSYYMPHWTQPGLIPRDRQRGDRFENVAFFGVAQSLAPEMKQPSWSEQLKALGLNWIVVSPERWHDFSKVDAIVAVRSFTSKDYGWKPAQKLYNAWHAGVPAILGCESGYQAERKSQLDYLEVASLQETIAALKRLRDDKDLRRAMVENGLVRAKETQLKKLVEQWRTLFADAIIPSYECYCGRSYWSGQTFLVRRYLYIKTKGLKHCMHSIGANTTHFMQPIVSHARAD